MDPNDERVVDPHHTAFEGHTLDRVCRIVEPSTIQMTMARKRKPKKSAAPRDDCDDEDALTSPMRERRHFAAGVRAKVSEHMSRSRTPVLSDMDAKVFRRELLRGEWSLVDHFDREGKRYFTWARIRGEWSNQRSLTKREKDVLERVAEGHTDRSIAIDLRCSPSTVATHRLRAMSKLGLRSRSLFSQILAAVALDDSSTGS
jgi:DNA-binding CsgD family transcriptional regulator